MKRQPWSNRYGLDLEAYDVTNLDDNWWVTQLAANTFRG